MFVESTITAGLIGLAMALVKVVELLVKRHSAAKPTQASPFNGSTDKIIGAAEKLHDASIRLDISVGRLERACERLEDK